MEDIFSWCREGHTLQVRCWLDDPKNDPNQGDEHGFSPLHWACFVGRTNIAEMLLSRGARINCTNLGDDTSLHLAASHGHMDCVKLLLRNRADVNASNEHGNTPLHYACFWGYQLVAEELLAHGAQANLANVAGETACDKCHRKLVGRLVELAQQVHKQDLSKRLSYRDAGQLQRQLELRTRDAKLSSRPEIGLKELELNSKLFHSWSGESWCGTWSGLDICAKFINYGPQINSRITRQFNEELPRLRIFSHPNLLPVLGGSADPSAHPRSLLLVSQYLPLGSLYSLLHERKHFAVDKVQALRFVLDIGRAMAFLHSLEPLITTLNLNSFHVLVDDHLSARVNMADARMPFEERYKLYQPAWAAPELLQSQRGQVNIRAADMWSFGVLLWEISSRQVPFAGLSALEVGMKVALEELRLGAVPAAAGGQQHLSKLMRLCMNEDPGKRPSFDQIVPILTKMLNVASATS